MPTLEEKLESVEKAIAAIEGGGQEFESEMNENRQRIRRADIKELYRREAQLKMAILRKNGGGVRYGIPR